MVTSNSATNNNARIGVANLHWIDTDPGYESEENNSIWETRRGVTNKSNVYMQNRGNTY